MTAGDANAKPEPAADDGGGSPGMSVRTRRRIAVTLVILATLTGILALVSTWVKRQVYDTDQWVATSSALLADDEIRTELADYLTTQIFASGVVQEEVAKLAMTAIEYPPMQKGASFNLEAVKEKIEAAIKAQQGR